LNFAYSQLNIPKELIRSEHARGIYYTPLYDKTCEFLRKECEVKDLTKSFDTSVENLVEIWKQKHAKPRIKQLAKKDKVSTESLFYDDLIYLTWEQAKEKYLPQVGR
jgi:thiamine biosynthesis lipoprotein ApbE